MSEQALIDRVADAIRARRFRYVDEDRLQAGIAEALIADGFRVAREHRLDARSRLDLLVDGRVAVEVKIAGSAAIVQRQVARYLAHDLAGVVLVTSRSRHLRVADDRVRVVCLNGASL